MGVGVEGGGGVEGLEIIEERPNAGWHIEDQKFEFNVEPYNSQGRIQSHGSGWWDIPSTPPPPHTHTTPAHPLKKCKLKHLTFSNTSE